MSERTACMNCRGDLTEYYNREYRGMRGRCPACQVDFPLE